jgi:23S rRNA (guanosine2251-2'-O)-methyltransferase
VARNARTVNHSTKYAPEELAMGRNCVQELLQHHPERVREVRFAQGADEPRAGRQHDLQDQVRALGIVSRACRREELDELVQSNSHQGIVAVVKPRAYLTLDQLVQQVERSPEVRIVALDGVLDPHNLGAILRAAECFNVDAVVWSKNRAAPVGPVVSKVSVGASELVPLCPVPNLHRALESLKQAGAWTVGAVVTPDATPLGEFEAPPKWVLVMGSEGEGIQHLVQENLDFRVYISMLGKVSSLNVSQAAAVMLHGLVGRSKSNLVP